MRFRSVVRVLAAALAGAILIGGIPARAQDGLSEEQIALIERAVRVHENLLNLSSYIEEAQGSSTETTTVSVLGQSQSLVRSVTLKRTAKVVHSDGKENIQANITAAIQESGTASAVSYTVNAEARVIEGVLYVKLAYAQPAPALPELPAGWTIVENLDELAVYDDLRLEDLLKHSPLYSDTELLKAAVADVTAETQTGDDGTAYDVLTFSVDPDGLRLISRAQLGDDANTEVANQLLDAISSDSYATITLTLRPDDQPVQFASETLTEVVDLDAHKLFPDVYSEGIRLGFVSKQANMQSFSHINEPLEPASVPDELTQ